MYNLQTLFVCFLLTLSAYADFALVTSTASDFTIINGRSFLYSNPTGASDGTVYLTNDYIYNAANAFWWNSQVQVANGFTSTFSIKFPATPGTNGFAFVVQNNALNLVGGNNNNLGYNVFTQSVAVAFSFNPPSVSVQSNGNIGAAGAGNTAPILASLLDGNFHTCIVTYNGASLSVSIDGTNVLTSVTINIASRLGSNSGWVGFTASTGSQAASINLRSWNLVCASSACNVQFTAGSISGFTLVDGSVFTPNSIMLTNVGNFYEDHAIWYNQPQTINNGFNTSFWFRIIAPAPVGGQGPADGFAFVVQNTGLNSIGAPGTSLGLNTISPSVSVRFVTYTTDGSDQNAIKIYSNNQLLSSELVLPLGPHFSLYSGDDHHVIISMTTSTVTVWMDDQLITSANLNVASVVGGSAFVGFTGSGDASPLSETDFVHDWISTSLAPAPSAISTSSSTIALAASTSSSISVAASTSSSSSASTSGTASVSAAVLSSSTGSVQSSSTATLLASSSTSISTTGTRAPTPTVTPTDTPTPTPTPTVTRTPTTAQPRTLAPTPTPTLTTTPTQTIKVTPTPTTALPTTAATTTVPTTASPTTLAATTIVATTVAPTPTLTPTQAVTTQTIITQTATASTPTPAPTTVSMTSTPAPTTVTVTPIQTTSIPTSVEQTSSPPSTVPITLTPTPSPTITTTIAITTSAPTPSPTPTASFTPSPTATPTIKPSTPAPTASLTIKLTETPTPTPPANVTEQPTSSPQLCVGICYGENKTINASVTATDTVLVNSSVLVKGNLTIVGTTVLYQSHIQVSDGLALGSDSVLQFVLNDNDPYSMIAVDGPLHIDGQCFVNITVDGVSGNSSEFIPLITASNTTGDFSLIVVNLQTSGSPCNSQYTFQVQQQQNKFGILLQPPPACQPQPRGDMKLAWWIDLLICVGGIVVVVVVILGALKLISKWMTCRAVRKADANLQDIKAEKQPLTPVESRVQTGGGQM